MLSYSIAFEALVFLGTLRCSGVISSSWTSSFGWWGDSVTGLGAIPSVSGILWDKDSLSSKISVRLIKKSWKPKGVRFDHYTDEFPESVEEAYKILRGNNEYEYIERPLSKAFELFTVPEFNRNLNSIIFVHPLFSHGDEGYFTKPTITALGMRNIHREYNLFVYHMPALTINFIFTIIQETFGYQTRYEDVAEVLSTFILDGLRHQHWTANKLNFLGYSYSGNLVGYIARDIRLFSNNKVSSIICLDPYSAQYNQDLIHVNKDDAEVVHILHTSSYVEGTRERIGTADFVFNDGFLQPECAGFMTVTKKIFNFQVPEPFTCSHLRVVPRFWYVILFPSKFKVRKCDTWPRFSTCLCEENEHGFISYPIASRSLQGTFYLRTTSSKPYGLKEEGSHCTPEERKKFDKKLQQMENSRRQLVN